MIVAVFWIVKPVKRGLLLSFYDARPVRLMNWTIEAAEIEQFAKVLNMVAAFVAVAVFTHLVRRFDRRRVVLLLCLSFAALFALFGVFISSASEVLAWSLYVCGDVYATLMVGTFWALTNDLTRSGEAERSYGMIGFGGVLGGFVGATFVRGWVEAMGRAPMLVVCALLLILIAVLVAKVEARAMHDHDRRGTKLESTGRTSAWSEGAKLALSSRYLLGLVALVASYEIVSSIIDFQLAATVAREISGTTEKDAFFALVGQLVGLVSIAVQLLFTGFIMRRLGIGVALLLLPTAVAAGAILFIVVPSLLFAALLSTSDNALNYSVNQSAREALYVPLSREEKYKAKAFIDMFVQRTAKVAAVGLNLVVAQQIGLLHVRWLSIAVIGIVGAWVIVVRWLSQQHAGMASAGAPCAERCAPAAT